jgi:hypothetical protein
MTMTRDNNIIYPKFEPQPVLKEYLHEEIDITRIREMMREQKVLYNELQNCKKEKHKLIKAFNLIKYGGGGILILMSVAGIVLVPLSLGVIALPLECVALGGAVATSAILEVLDRYIKVKRNRSKIIQMYLDRLYVYVQKAKEDKVISHQEIDGFRKIIDEYRKEKDRLHVDVDVKKIEREVKDTF